MNPPGVRPVIGARVIGIRLISLVLLAIGVPASVAAQGRAWHVDVGGGLSSLVDDAPKRYWLVTGSVRRSLTPRLSVGPEIQVMGNDAVLTDRIVVVTGNVTFDLVADNAPKSRRVVPFIVGGVGVFIGRDSLTTGGFWHSDPAFTTGAGLRARITSGLSVGAEYRLGWELHQRVSGSCTFGW